MKALIIAAGLVTMLSASAQQFPAPENCPQMEFEFDCGTLFGIGSAIVKIDGKPRKAKIVCGKDYKT